ncbi:MAG: prepilin-type N-terminal cleavage/methylation domain-containing protein [Gemmatimonadetes bacterium]|nr:prepilin-type N-terminal cleavage/methylation domain-containing protein [Gemmatimonadota bacterium]
MSARSPGFTIVELLVVFVVGAIVVTAIFRTLTIQQDSYRHESAVIGVQQASRTALDLLGSEFRGLSSTRGDVVVTAAESLTVRAFRKLGFACNSTAGSTALDVWQLGEAFAVGDSVLYWADRDSASFRDDAWKKANIQAVGTVPSGLCATWLAISLADSVLGPFPTQRLTLSVADSLRRGAQVRSFARVTYGLFSVNGQWVLGRHEPSTAAVALVGPLAQPSEGGLAFRYLKFNGAQVTLGSDTIARIEITVRAKTTQAALTGNSYTDSLKANVLLRNTPRS